MMSHGMYFHYKINIIVKQKIFIRPNTLFLIYLVSVLYRLGALDDP